MAPRKHPEQLEDWDLFVLRHQKTPNVVVHSFSFFLFWVSPVLGLFVSPWWWLGFFGSGLVGTAGHFLFQDGTVDAKEATSSAQVVHFSSVLFFLFWSGRWTEEIRLSKEKFARYSRGEIRSVANPLLFSKLGRRPV